ncbi:universal stress protein [Nitrosopumilus sp. Nsub]|uniref:universal stress protein n=1 Tax=Nitrosopumilus sp. Nsub TaxID=1776294 RepID=UPI00082AF383|nr:universal stress protein [Nitrosopumilus sp. Nsub]
MTKIKKILVALDGSKNSLRGLDMGIDLAKQSHGTITALSIKPIPDIYAFHPLGFMNFDKSSEIKKLLASAKTRAEKKGIKLNGKMISGDPGYDIVKFANNPKNKIDIIVIGARGIGAAKELFFGSVSNYVMHKSKKPVLVIK